jgi:hypothetical protein
LKRLLRLANPAKVMAVAVAAVAVAVAAVAVAATLATLIDLHRRGFPVTTQLLPGLLGS